MMRTAISPRLAIRTFFMKYVQAPLRASGFCLGFASLFYLYRVAGDGVQFADVRAGLQRDVPVLLRRVFVPFVLEILEGHDQLSPGFTRTNHLVQESTRRSDIRDGG